MLIEEAIHHRQWLGYQQAERSGERYW